MVPDLIYSFSSRGALSYKIKSLYMPIKPKFCGQCGTENPIKNNFCYNCGAKLFNSKKHDEAKPIIEPTEKLDKRYEPLEEKLLQLIDLSGYFIMNNRENFV
ncbi:hypothetical protein ABIB40_001073 [Pedobacter sp. UYP30]|uniref:zinc-ribbon domain-containing protein n=1 Tax=Pedobacter sp. UYP30 TaxID=1756400 RepID=UPI0033926CF3